MDEVHAGERVHHDTCKHGFNAGIYTVDRKARTPCKIISGAAGYNTQGNTCMGNSVHPEIDHPVSPCNNEDIQILQGTADFKSRLLPGMACQVNNCASQLVSPV